MLANLRQDLLEAIADWLGGEAVTTEEVLAGIWGDPEKDGELHIRMADAAMKVYTESRFCIIAANGSGIAEGLGIKPPKLIKSTKDEYRYKC